MLGSSKRFVLIALFTALLIVLVNVAWWYYYQRTENMLDNQLSRRLGAVGELTATMLPPEQLDLLSMGDITAYLDVAGTLERVRRTDSLSEVFIVDENYRYLATTLLSSDSLYFLAPLHAPLIDSLFLSPVIAPQAVITDAYQTGNVLLKSAFIPLTDPDGLVAAVLGVEANIDYSEPLAELRQNLWYATGLSLAGGILLGLIFLWLQRRINHAEQQLFLGETHAHLGRMVAVVAHELRNPLMIIRASAERVRKKSDLPEAGFVLEEVDRLNDIVTGYLDFARSGGNLLSADMPSQIDIADLLGRLRTHLSEKYNGEAITWLGEVPLNQTFVSYPRSLKQVLMNLLINGVEACRESDKPIEVGVDVVAPGETIELNVRDHGRGLNSKDLKKVFAPFYTTKRTGSGLGLYLSRRLVEEMGGSMHMTSSPDRGTVVVIKLPREPKSNRIT